MERERILFNRFLQRNSLFDAFYRYHNDSRETVERWTGHSLEDYFKENDPELYIQLAFAWSSTSQGHTAWDKAGREWRKFLKKNQNTLFIDQNTTVI
jgi:hypothetical protein